MKSSLLMVLGVVAVFTAFLVIDSGDSPTPAENHESFEKLEKGHLESRSGPALERTVQRAIRMVGYRCDNVRHTSREKNGVYVDCGPDGKYAVFQDIMDPKNIRVLKE